MCSPPRWRQVLADAISDPQELIGMLGLPPELAATAEEGSDTFPLLVPRSFVERMRPGNASDPLLRQVLPTREEIDKVAGFDSDPLCEKKARCAPGLLQKYPGRALLLLTDACAMHCRYCFRRNRAVTDSPHDRSEFAPAIDFLSNDLSIHEIILSGGDPLSLDDDQLTALIGQLAAIPHLRRLRIHTRLPVAIPERVTDALVNCLTRSRLAPIVVVQVNHHRELDAPCADALRKLLRAGIPVLNQSVLLRGINDSAEALTRLCERLADLCVMPYYLHQLDPVSGTAHFHVPMQTGKGLIDNIREHLPGYAIPRYVQEIRKSIKNHPRLTSDPSFPRIRIILL
ncbi:MAG: EF-P beta-lysylation protein EpmB [Planctomycetes bacterium]|nr:EF-P beta-lysylation protein EpmB [Planctomycetota bacterium]